MANPKEEAEKEYKALQGLQKDMQKQATSLNGLMTQLSENELVKMELDLLEEDANIFKLVGPTLIKQELEEARVNVNKRIEFLTAEIKRVENSIEDLDQRKQKKTQKIMQMQQLLQAQAQQAKQQ